MQFLQRRFLFSAVGMAVMFSLAGCTKREGGPITSGKVLAAQEVADALPGRAPFLPDAGYAVVNSAWLPAFYERWKADLFSKGVVKWEARFDCNKFAASYCAAAQLEFYRDMFHSWNPSQALAVGEVWYRQDRGGNHAIVVALTERGALFIEPQTGKELALSPAELSSIYFKRF